MAGRFPGLAMMVVIANSCCHAGILNVPGQFPTIQSAVDASVDGDVIVLANGVYSGDGNWDVHFGGRSITVKSQSGPGNCTIDLEDLQTGLPRRAFHLQENEPATAAIRGLTIVNGRAQFGGAIYCENNASPVISNCVFMRNRADEDGGAISLREGAALVCDCWFEDNECSISGCLQMRHCCGMGIGGAIALIDTNATVTRCVIVGNRSNGSGGGIGVDTFDPFDPPPPAAFSPTISDCIVARNRAIAGDGGGAACYAGTPVFRNCTFVAGRSACPGGGLAAVFDVDVRVRNCIFYMSDGGFSGDEMTTEFGAQLTVDESMVAGGHDGVLIVPNAQLIWGPNNVDGNPLIVAEPNAGEDGLWATNDDFPGDYRLSAASPCIDAVIGGTGSIPWQRDVFGNVRRWDGDGDGLARTDRGAHEFAAPPSGDLDGDCDVDLQDLATLLAHFGGAGDFADGDTDGDGDIDLQDLASLLSRFGGVC